MISNTGFNTGIGFSATLKQNLVYREKDMDGAKQVVSEGAEKARQAYEENKEDKTTYTYSMMPGSGEKGVILFLSKGKGVDMKTERKVFGKESTPDEVKEWLTGNAYNSVNSKEESAPPRETFVHSDRHRKSG